MLVTASPHERLQSKSECICSCFSVETGMNEQHDFDSIFFKEENVSYAKILLLQKVL